jgi:hypothetical protein
MIIQISRLEAAPLVAGPGCPTRVMSLIGATKTADLKAQRRKLDALVHMDQTPDIIADLSIVRTSEPLWRSILATGRCAATLPIYTVARRADCIDEKELLDVALTQMRSGVGILTIHPTPTRELIQLAQIVSCRGPRVAEELSSVTYLRIHCPIMFTSEFYPISLPTHDNLGPFLVLVPPFAPQIFSIRWILSSSERSTLSCASPPK